LRESIAVLKIFLLLDFRGSGKTKILEHPDADAGKFSVIRIRDLPDEDFRGREKKPDSDLIGYAIFLFGDFILLDDRDILRRSFQEKGCPDPDMTEGPVLILAEDFQQIQIVKIYERKRDFIFLAEGHGRFLSRYDAPERRKKRGVL